MIPHKLLAIGIFSTLMVLDIPTLNPDTSSYKTITIAQVQQCNPNDPKNCP